MLYRVYVKILSIYLVILSSDCVMIIVVSNEIFLRNGGSYTYAKHY